MGMDVKRSKFFGGCNFEKADTYVFAKLIIRDREVGGSNPLAPTNIPDSLNYITS
jgi:hypothetical protein